MTDAESGRVAAIQERVAGFSLLWLAVANAVGVWLALLLIWPRLGDLLGEYGYGRWMPLHMDWQLYGWCALPSLGLIAVRFWKHDGNGAELSGRAFALWSAALLVGGAGWLAGEATGKPFLNWSGFSRVFFVNALAFVWGMVAISWWRRSREPKLDWWIDGLLVAGLAAVPIVMYIVSDAKVYPPVNPHSGGATGHSLLLSTLGIVGLMGVLPRWALGKKVLADSKSRRAVFVFWILFILSIGIYLLIQHGHVSNREFDQIFGLGSLMVWPFLVAWLWRGYQWSESSRPWRVVFVFWWSALALSGWLTFLPGILDTIKFTNGMVAHAHLAMAGMVTALNMIILIELGKSPRVRGVLRGKGLVWLWNGSLVVFVVALLVQGVREGGKPGALFVFDGKTMLAYSLRLVAGGGLFAVSLLWVVDFWRRRI